MTTAFAMAAAPRPPREGARRQDGSRNPYSYRESPSTVFVPSDGRRFDDVEAPDAYRDRYDAQRYGRRGAHVKRSYERRANHYDSADEDYQDDEGPSPYWHVPFEWGFSILCVYGCLCYFALITGRPSFLAPH